MKLYVVRNKEGKFFRPVGFGGGGSGNGKNWQDTLEKAKFYPKIGTAKTQASFWYREYPSYGCPDILEFDLDPTKAVVLNVQEETDKNIRKREELKKRKEAEYKAWLNSEPKPH